MEKETYEKTEEETKREKQNISKEVKKWEKERCLGAKS
jgi:hypothetical protein